MNSELLEILAAKKNQENRINQIHDLSIFSISDVLSAEMYCRGYDFNCFPLLKTISLWIVQQVVQNTTVGQQYSKITSNQRQP